MTDGRIQLVRNVHPYILNQPSTHIGLFSQLKRVTLTQQMRVKFQCHTFKQKYDKKAEFTPILVPRDLRKKE